MPVFFYFLNTDFDITETKTCAIINSFQFSILHISKISLVHLVAAMSLVRFIDIKFPRYQEYTEKIKYIICGTVIYGLCLSVTILYEIISARHESVPEDPAVPRTTKVYTATIVVHTFSLTVTSTITFWANMFLKWAIQSHNNKFSFLQRIQNQLMSSESQQQLYYG